MSREFDSFILIPEFADKALKEYDFYLGKNSEEYSEMALIYFKGINATYIHDATDKEENTIELFEKSDTGLRSILQKELNLIDKNLLINSNVFLASINILPEEDENYHLAKFTFTSKDQKINIFTYGLDIVSVNE